MKKFAALFCAFAITLAGCNTQSTNEQEQADRPIGIIGAMDTEVKTLKANLKNTEVTKKAGLEFHAGELSGKKVVVVQSGIGKVNAALCTQILIDEFNVRALINTGVAGGLFKDLAVGDVVIASQAVEHDFDVTAFGHKKGYVAGMHGDGNPTYFETDEALAKLVKEVASEVLEDNKAYIGTVASGDVFVADPTLKTELITNFDAYAAEMEGAAIAHVAFANDLPTTIIR
ncbi:MAG: 5'-methylthioadenosine/adenosylhomocysteine nucleosidase, partial [Bacilli bacterium]